MCSLGEDVRPSLRPGHPRCPLQTARPRERTRTRPRTRRDASDVRAAVLARVPALVRQILVRVLARVPLQVDRQLAFPGRGMVPQPGVGEGLARRTRRDASTVWSI